MVGRGGGGGNEFRTKRMINEVMILHVRGGLIVGVERLDSYSAPIKT